MNVFSGVVELREDVPLKAGAGFGAGGDEGCCAGGPRLILLAFAALSAAITLALLTQIYYGDYEVLLSFIQTLVSRLTTHSYFRCDIFSVILWDYIYKNVPGFSLEAVLCLIIRFIHSFIFSSKLPQVGPKHMRF